MVAAKTRRRLLIVAVEFPPVKGIGRLRPLKFCHHLNALGWDTAVLTLATGDMQPVDEATLAEIPQDTLVYRVARPQPRHWLVKTLKSRLHRVKDSTAPNETALSHTENTTSDGGASMVRAGSLQWLKQGIARLDRWVYRHLLVPDDLVLWWFPAIRRGAAVVEEFRPDVILATAPHFTSLLVGARLARKTDVPWVADYRDLWTGDVLRAWVPPWRRRLELAIEKRCVSTASAVITVSEPKTAVMRSRLPSLPAHALVTLTNGYDPEEFDTIVPEGSAPGVLRIVYAGRLFKNRRGYELLEAVGVLLAERPELRQRLRLEYYGGRAPEIVARMDELVSTHRLTGVFEFFPDVPYQRSKALQKGADVLLLIVDGGETTSGVIPGKLFEYMAANRPILCIAEEGATPEIIRRGRLGWVQQPGDVDGLKARLADLLDRPQLVFEPDLAFVQGFERRHLVARLAEVLERVAK